MPIRQIVLFLLALLAVATISAHADTPTGSCPSPSQIVANGQYLSTPLNPNNPQACVSLVQNLDPSVGNSPSWQAGDPVSCSTPVGTPVATFNYSYGGSLHYGSQQYPAGQPGAGMTHTGIFNGCTSTGQMQLLNQWMGQTPTLTNYNAGTCGTEYCMGSYYTIKSGAPVYGPNAACAQCSPGSSNSAATPAPGPADATTQ